jgi:CheY-like chemotaxis protein
MPEADLLQVEFAPGEVRTNGGLALRAIETAGFDLAIIDVNLPEISGYVLARRAAGDLPRSGEAPNCR